MAKKQIKGCDYLRHIQLRCAWYDHIYTTAVEVDMQIA